MECFSTSPEDYQPDNRWRTLLPFSSIISTRFILLIPKSKSVNEFTECHSKRDIDLLNKLTEYRDKAYSVIVNRDFDDAIDQFAQYNEFLHLVSMTKYQKLRNVCYNMSSSELNDSNSVQNDMIQFNKEEFHTLNANLNSFSVNLVIEKSDVSDLIFEKHLAMLNSAFLYIIHSYTQLINAYSRLRNCHDKNKEFYKKIQNHLDLAVKIAENLKFEVSVVRQNSKDFSLKDSAKYITYFGGREMDNFLNLCLLCKECAAVDGFKNYVGTLEEETKLAEGYKFIYSKLVKTNELLNKIDSEYLSRKLYSNYKTNARVMLDAFTSYCCALISYNNSETGNAVAALKDALSVLRNSISSLESKHIEIMQDSFLNMVKGRVYKNTLYDVLTNQQSLQSQYDWSSVVFASQKNWLLDKVENDTFTKKISNSIKYDEISVLQRQIFFLFYEFQEKLNKYTSYATYIDRQDVPIDFNRWNYDYNLEISNASDLDKRNNQYTTNLYQKCGANDEVIRNELKSILAISVNDSQHRNIEFTDEKCEVKFSNLIQDDDDDNNFYHLSKLSERMQFCNQTVKHPQERFIDMKRFEDFYDLDNYNIPVFDTLNINEKNQHGTTESFKMEKMSDLSVSDEKRFNEGLNYIKNRIHTCQSVISKNETESARYSIAEFLILSILYHNIDSSANRNRRGNHNAVLLNPQEIPLVLEYIQNKM